MSRPLGQQSVSESEVTVSIFHLLSIRSLGTSVRWPMYSSLRSSFVPVAPGDVCRARAEGLPALVPGHCPIRRDWATAIVETNAAELPRARASQFDVEVGVGRVPYVVYGARSYSSSRRVKLVGDDGRRASC